MANAALRTSTVSESLGYFTLDAPAISAGQVTLPSIPSDPTKVRVDVNGGPSQVYGIDFVVVVNILTWLSYGMATVLSVGDVIRVDYLN